MAIEDAEFFIRKELTDTEKAHRALAGAQRPRLHVLGTTKDHHPRETVLSVRNVVDKEDKSLDWWRMSI